ALDGETAGGGYDQTDATGAVDLDASTGLNVTLSDGFTPAVGDTFTIIQSTGGITGSFASLPEGTVFDAGGQSFRISYANDDVTLTCVANTSTTASPSLSTSTYGQTVTYTVTVSNTSFGGGAPTGTVELYDGSTDLGIGATLSGNGSTATATLSTSSLPAGSHAIYVIYTPSGHFQGSSSSDQALTVNPAALTITASNQTKV